MEIRLDVRTARTMVFYLGGGATKTFMENMKKERLLLVPAVGTHRRDGHDRTRATESERVTGERRGVQSV